jgi:flagellar protein FliT
MSAVKAFYQVTDKLIKLIEMSQGEREETINEIERLLDEREAWMKELVPPYIPEEIKIGQELIQLNSKLIKLLQTEKIEIQKDIKDLQTKKQSNTKYVNPYRNISSDGMFYDKRK